MGPLVVSGRPGSAEGFPGRRTGAHASVVPGSQLLQQGLERLEDPGGRGDGQVPVRAQPGTAAGERAGLPGDQVTGGQVPGVQAPLEVAVEPARGHVAEVDGGRSTAADPPRRMSRSRGISRRATSAWWVRTSVT